MKPSAKDGTNLFMAHYFALQSFHLYLTIGFMTTVISFLNDLKSELLDNKLACAKRLSTFALSLGPEGLRNELLPVITGFHDFFSIFIQ